jgi:hypothetical protein
MRHLTILRGFDISPYNTSGKRFVNKHSSKFESVDLTRIAIYNLIFCEFYPLNVFLAKK